MTDPWDAELEYEPPPGSWWSQQGTIVALAGGAALAAVGVLAAMMLSGGDSLGVDDTLRAPDVFVTTTTERPVFVLPTAAPVAVAITTTVPARSVEHVAPGDVAARHRGGSSCRRLRRAPRW